MYFSEVLASCRRRWYLLLVLLALSAVLLWQVAGRIPPTYESSASVVLVPPKDVETPRLNRYLDLGSMADSVDVVARSMTSTEVAADLAEEYPDADFEVAPDLTTSAPILLVTASSPTPETTSRVVAELIIVAKQNLERLQDQINVNQRFRITAITVAEDPKPVKDLGTQRRIVAMLGAALVFGSFLGVAVLDGLLLWRRERPRRPRMKRGASRDSEAPGEPDAPAPAQGTVESSHERRDPAREHEAVGEPDLAGDRGGGR